MRKEDTAAFTWAFDEYLDWCCDGGLCPPGVILTDDSNAAAAAIKASMPSTKHLLCSWHLYKNLKEHTDKHVRSDPNLLRACRAGFRQAEYAATQEEFDACWRDLMVSELIEDTWCPFLSAEIGAAT
ncbi:unnamed protein product [Phaeothamnion confervicola]